MNSPDIVVVSGAGTGIGRAVSHRLVADGFHVIAAGRRPGPLDLLANELAPHLDAVSADLTSSGRAGSPTSPGGSARRRPWWAGKGRRRRSRRSSAGCSGRMAAG